MIYRPSNTLTLVVYEDQKTAQCFHLGKKELRFLVLLVPGLIIAAIFSVLFIFSYYKNMKVAIKEFNVPITSSSPDTSKSLVDINLKEENKKLLEKNQNLDLYNKNLLIKINSGKISKLNLPFFAASTAAEDLTARKVLTISNETVKLTPQGPALTFDMTNSTSNNEKLSGHIFVFMQNQSQINIYPNLNNNLLESSLKFNMGEPFTFSHFRPVEANFTALTSPSPAAKDKPPLFFKVFIFSRTGDLLVTHKIGPLSYPVASPQ